MDKSGAAQVIAVVVAGDCPRENATPKRGRVLTEKVVQRHHAARRVGAALGVDVAASRRLSLLAPPPLVQRCFVLRCFVVFVVKEIGQFVNGRKSKVKGLNICLVDRGCG